MLLILTIRLNLILETLTLFIESSLLDNTQWTEYEKRLKKHLEEWGRTEVEQSSHRAIATRQSFSQSKRIHSRREYATSDDVTVTNIRIRKLQFDPKNLRSLLLIKFLFDFDETEEESEEDDDDIDYDQILITRKFKVIDAKIIQVTVLYFERAWIQSRFITRWSKAENLRLGKQVQWLLPAIFIREKLYTFWVDVE